MAKKSNEELDQTTEEKIKSAARKIFTQKGYSAAKTRDIAGEAGINLALLNYYFRSKEKLFQIIMLEIIQSFIHGMSPIFSNKDTTFEEKIEAFVGNYIDLLTTNPDIPLFMLHEIRTNPAGLMSKTRIREEILETFFFQQLQEEVKAGRLKMHPMQLIMNILSLTIFPFVASPMLKQIGNFSEHQFNEMMIERKKFIPIWVKQMLN